MTIVDNHVHVLNSGLKRIVEAALQEKVSVLSVTEHIYQFEELRKFRPFSTYPLEGRRMSLARYSDSITAERTRFPNLKLGVGAEVDYVSSPEEGLREEFPSNLDIVLCAVHQIAGIDLEKLPPPKDSRESARRWDEYFRLMHQAVETSYAGLNVVAHPTRLALSTPRLPGDLEESLFELANIAAARDVVLEINLGDVIDNPAAVVCVARACARAGTPVSVGTDAHFVPELRAREPLGQEFMERFGLKAVTYCAGRQIAPD